MARCLPEVGIPYLWHQRLRFHARCCFPAVRLNRFRVITRYKHLDLFSAPAGSLHKQPVSREQKNLVAVAEIEEAASLCS